MRPTYTDHARIRMRERHVSESEVEAVLHDPLIQIPGHHGCTKYIGRPKGRHVEVVVNDDTPPCVVTVIAD